ncbi:hypothetical protein GCM10010275_31630 [Streptomyces litmocidini]|uniref:hypothetical protein n=1 Tax=Streptomyces litmocidini TaxID=67318 RepID=UPI00167EE92C|nr:hypothetical protein [Streptomyces litmocidini]GGU92240.1 hypothetical protein GCM10010275_31630 [Streptomyces litmocidini]
MDTEPGSNRREQVTDWLESHPDLPHLFARLAELVHVAGYAPEDLVVLPRAEVDRRETTAFTAGWAEAVSDELPRIRREYERRVADAYAQGQGDARGIRRPQRRTDAAPPDGARVIPLPFARLMEPPAAVVEAEERVRRERELFEQRPGPEPAPPPAPVLGYEPVPLPGYGPEPEHASDREPDPGHGSASDPEPESGADARVGAQESRPRRNAQPVRKVVRGKGGRPIVPPIGGVPGQAGGSPERRGRRLSERARTLEEELAERAQETPPDPAS